MEKENVFIIILQVYSSKRTKCVASEESTINPGKVKLTISKNQSEFTSNTKVEEFQNLDVVAINPYNKSDSLFFHIEIIN